MSFALRLSFFLATAYWTLKAAAGMAVVIGTIWVVIAVVTGVMRRLRRAGRR